MGTPVHYYQVQYDNDEINLETLDEVRDWLLEAVGDTVAIGCAHEIGLELCTECESVDDIGEAMCDSCVGIYVAALLEEDEVVDGVDCERLDSFVEDWITSTYEDIEIMGLTFSPYDVIKECDPIGLDQLKHDYVDGALHN